jgi:hypothetical protein
VRLFLYISLFLYFFTSFLFAEETRQVDKHEHGVGELNIAIQSNTMVLEFMIPGADVVGFEYEAKSEQDKATVSAALTKFDDYNNIFIIPTNSKCILISSKININQEDEHDEHDEHDDHDGHDDHDEHQEEAHNEFYAKYTFECGDIKSLDLLEFPYFETFSNSGELEVQFVSEIGSTSFEVEADSPIINIEGKI